MITTVKVFSNESVNVVWILEIKTKTGLWALCSIPTICVTLILFDCSVSFSWVVKVNITTLNYLLKLLLYILPLIFSVKLNVVGVVFLLTENSHIFWNRNLIVNFRSFIVQS